MAVIVLETFADDLVMVGQHLRVEVLAQAPKEARRSLDVGEEEGECFDA
jgi:hypothetical protein